MKTRAKSKAAISGFLSIILLATAYGQRLERVPIFVPEGIFPTGDAPDQSLLHPARPLSASRDLAGYSNRSDDHFYARVQQGGDGRLAVGEYLIWRYAFPWKARETNGKTVVNLVQYKSIMMFLAASPTHLKVKINGIIASIKKPPNIGGLKSIFKYAAVSIREANKAIIFNRLGQPDKSSTANGENWVLYSSTVTKTRTRHKVVYGSATGTTGFGAELEVVHLDTTTYVPVNEKITFQPYCFKIHFDKNDNVTKVDDFVDRTVGWVKQ